MRKSVFVLIFIFSASGVFAQPPERFIKYYQPIPEFGGESFGVVETSYGYMVSGVSFDTINGSMFTFYTLMGIDFMGNQLWQKKYGGMGFNFYGGWLMMDWIRKHGNEYYSLNLIQESVNQSTVHISCFDEYGDTLWTKRIYGDTIDSIIDPRSMSRCSNGDFLISGRTFTSGSGMKQILIRTDSIGEVIWKRKYNQVVTGAEELKYTLQDDSTKNYYMLSMYGNPAIGWLYIADSAGNIFSQKNLTGSNGGVLTSMRQLSNGDFIASCTRWTGVVLGGFKLRQQYLVRFNRNGDIVWSRVFGSEGISNEITALEITLGDTIIASGQYDTLYVQNKGLNSMFRIIKVTPDGDLVWERNIDLTVDNPNFDFLKGMALTSDGGYALTGCFPSNPSPQPFVLVKLDAYGCDTANCQFVGVNETDSPGLSLYPNPASTTLRFDVTGDYLLKTFEIYSMNGRLVSSGKLPDQEVSLDVSRLSPGLYLIRLTGEKDHQWTGRFLVGR